MKIRTLNVPSMLFAALFLLVGCKEKPAPPASGPPQVSLVLDWKPEPEFGGFYAAQLNGAFISHNLDVKIQNAGPGAPTWQLVANKQADFATTAADQVFVARKQGADVVAIFAVYQTSPQGIMVHPARGFKTIEDVFKNSGTLAAEDNPWLSFCLKKFEPVKVTVTAFSGGIAGFLAQPTYSQQCFVTSEPILAAKQGGDPQTFLVADTGYNPYTTVVITRGQIVRSDPARVHAMIDACREGWRAYLDDSAAANGAMGKLNPDMDAQTFSDAATAQKPLIETDETKANGLGSMTSQRWNELAQQLKSLNVIESAPPAEECFVDWARK